MKKVLRVLLFSLFFSVFCGNFLFSESFRVDSVVPVSMSVEGVSEKAMCGINDALLIKLPKDMTFVKGIELSVKIPQEVSQWRDSVAYSIYENLTPAPNEKSIDYDGKRVSVNTFPSRLSTTIFIPLVENNNIKENPYSVKIPYIVSSKSGSVFFRLQLVMKGVSEGVEKSKFEITAKSVLSDEGRLLLKIKEPETTTTEVTGTPYTVFVDEKVLSVQKGGNVLATGEHHVSVVSDFYRNEVRTFRIDQAKTTTVEIDLRDIAPLVKILAPENAEIIFDGETLEKSALGGELPIKQGDHTVIFKIGDYEVVKSISAQNGRTYTVNLSIDANVTEE